MTLSPNFDDVSVLHVQLSRRLSVRHFAAVEVEADRPLGDGGHIWQVPGEDGAQRCVLKHTHTGYDITAAETNRKLMTEGRRRGATNSVQRELLRRVSVFALQPHGDAAAEVARTFILHCHDDALCTINRKKALWSRLNHLNYWMNCDESFMNGQLGVWSRCWNVLNLHSL